MQLSTTLQKLMKERELNEESLSELCNINIIQAKQIIEGSIIPGISTLIKISRALNVSVELLIDENDNSNVSFVSQAKRVKTNGTNLTTSSNLNIQSLAPNKPMRSMEPFMISIEQGSCDNQELSSHEGEEFAYVISGDAELILGDKKISLTAGDSIYYDSIIPHQYRAISEKVNLIAVVYTPW